MESKDPQQVVLSRAKKGEAPTKSFLIWMVQSVIELLNGGAEWFVKPVSSICYVRQVDNALFALKAPFKKSREN